MDEHAQALVQDARLQPLQGSVPLYAELGDCRGDRVVQAPVQRAELVDAERRIPLRREVGDRLAEVTVVVDDLVDRVAERQQLPAMTGRGDRHLRAAGRLDPGRTGDPQAVDGLALLVRLERLPELIDEVRDPVLQLLFGRGPKGALGGLGLAARDQVVAVVRQEAMHLCRAHHRNSSVGAVGPRSVTAGVGRDAQ